MPTHVVLLRGINVGAHNRIRMADLRSSLEEAGFDDPKTVLQTGNIVIDSDSPAPRVRELVEFTIGETFGVTSTTILRTAEDIQALQSEHPFSKAQLEAPRFAHVGFCLEEPDKSGFDEMLERHYGPEELWLGRREVFVYYTDGAGRSKITNAALEKHLGTPVTSRNWNTVLKIAEAMK